MCLAATVILAPHVWVLATFANADAARQAIALARGRRTCEAELPYPFVGTIAGVTLTCFAALAWPGVTAGELLSSSMLWAILLIPEWAWLVPAVVARLIARRVSVPNAVTPPGRYDPRGAFSTR